MEDIMANRNALALTGTLATAAMLAFAQAPSAQALTMKECSAKFQEARTAGTLNGMTWNTFRKAQCGAEATPAAATKTPSIPSAGSGSTVYPTAISPKYSKETAGKARMHTCLDQYKANKTSNGNGGLVWIAKGGGYYSECNKRLKG
jgi:hypothetical protein